MASTMSETIARDYYAILQIDESSDVRQIKRAYYHQSVLRHPDKNHGNEAAATEDFKLVGEAYEILGNPGRRKEYDAWYVEYKAHAAAEAEQAAREASRAREQEAMALEAARMQYESWVAHQKRERTKLALWESLREVCEAEILSARAGLDAARGGLAKLERVLAGGGLVDLLAELNTGKLPFGDLRELDTVSWMERETRAGLRWAAAELIRDQMVRTYEVQEKNLRKSLEDEWAKFWLPGGSVAVMTAGEIEEYRNWVEAWRSDKLARAAKGL